MFDCLIYKKTVFDWDRFSNNTGNTYKCVKCQPWNDKNGVLGNGFRLSLQIMSDAGDYGVDKKTGRKRDNNELETFEATILSTDVEPVKGDTVSLIGFDEEHSFVIGFDCILRFSGVKVLKQGKVS